MAFIEPLHRYKTNITYLRKGPLENAQDLMSQS